MDTNNVVSIRVEALGVSITIADGSIAIEQTKTEIPAATVSKTDSPTAAKQSLPELLPEGIDNRAPALIGSRFEYGHSGHGSRLGCARFRAYH